MQNLKGKTDKRIGHDCEAMRVADWLSLFSHQGTQFIHSLNGLHPNFSKAKNDPISCFSPHESSHSWVRTNTCKQQLRPPAPFPYSYANMRTHTHFHTSAPIHQHCYVSNQREKKRAQARCLWDDLISNDIWKWPHCANKIKLRPCLFLVLEICWVIKTGSPY